MPWGAATIYRYFTQLQVCIHRLHEVGKISVCEKKFLYHYEEKSPSSFCFVSVSAVPSYVMLW